MVRKPSDSVVTRTVPYLTAVPPVTMLMHTTASHWSSVIQDRLFDRFYQGNNSSDLHIEGTGIGLNLCKAFADPKQQPQKVRELEFTRPMRPKPHKSTFLC